MNEKAHQKYTKPFKGPEKISGMTGLEPVYTLLKSVGFLGFIKVLCVVEYDRIAC